MKIDRPRSRSRRAGSLILHAGVAGLAASTLSAEFGDRWWFADFFSHFRFQYIVVALALAVIAVLMRRRWTAAFACLLVVPQAIVIAGVPTAALAAPDASPRIRVAAANIQWSNTSFDVLARHFRDSQADVIALEELTDAAAPLIRALQADFPYVAPADWRERGSGVALLSRHPIENVRFVRAPLAPFVEATVRHPAGAFRIVGVHAPYPMRPSLYEAQTLYFETWVRQVATSDLPVIVTGDFNLTPWSPRFRVAWRGSGLRFAGDYRFWPRSWPAHATPWKYLPGILIGGIPIDHVLVSRQFAVIGLRRGPYIKSDHYPVQVDLQLRP